MEFENLYITSSSKLPKNFNAITRERIRKSENHMLMEISSVDEIKKSVWSLHPLKALDLMATQEYFSESIGILYKIKWSNLSKRFFRQET